MLRNLNLGSLQALEQEKKKGDSKLTETLCFSQHACLALSG